jgi:hypothetical protein
MNDFGCHYVNATSYYKCPHCNKCGKKKECYLIECKCDYCRCCSVCGICNKCNVYNNCAHEKCLSNKEFDINYFVGKTFIRIEKIILPNDIADYDADALLFVEDNGTRYVMFKKRDCCCTGEIKDIVGDFSDLLNTPILNAECVTNSSRDEDEYESETWTFYKLSTIKGYVTISWHSSSNGYYSEEVSLCLVNTCMDLYPYGGKSKETFDFLMKV